MLQLAGALVQTACLHDRLPMISYCHSVDSVGSVVPQYPAICNINIKYIHIY